MIDSAGELPSGQQPQSAENQVDRRGKLAFTETISSALHPEFAVKLCHQCYKPLQYTAAIRECPHCSFRRCCSVACLQADEFHKAECPFLIGKFTPWVQTPGECEPAAALALFRFLLKHARGKLVPRNSGEDSNDHALENDSIDFSELSGFISGLTFEEMKTNEALLEYDATQAFRLRGIARQVFDLFVRRPPTRDQWKLCLSALLRFGPVFTPIHHCLGVDLGTQSIGVVFDLSLPSYAHACVPNTSLYFQNNQVYIMPLDGRLDVRQINSVRVCNLLYSWLLSPQYREVSLNTKLLLERCKCSICAGPSIKRQTDILCAYCGYAIPFTVHLVSANDLKYYGPDLLGPCEHCSRLQSTEYLVQCARLLGRMLRKKMMEDEAAYAVGAKRREPHEQELEGMYAIDRTEANEWAPLLVEARQLLDTRRNLIYGMFCTLFPQQLAAKLDPKVRAEMLEDYFELLCHYVPPVCATPITDNIPMLFRLLHISVLTRKFELASRVYFRLFIGAANFFADFECPYQENLKIYAKYVHETNRVVYAAPSDLEGLLDLRTIYKHPELQIDYRLLPQQRYFEPLPPPPLRSNLRRRSQTNAAAAASDRMAGGGEPGSTGDGGASSGMIAAIAALGSMAVADGSVRPEANRTQPRRAVEFSSEVDVRGYNPAESDPWY